MGDEIMQTLHVNKLIKAKQMHYHLIVQGQQVDFLYFY